MAVGNGEALRAHMVMLAISSTLFAIILSTGFSLTGGSVAGYVSPIGVSVLVGAFLFGLGMQLGSGCASGTLYAVGGGKSSMFITLAAFIVGSVLGAYHWNFWMNETPSLEPISLAEVTPFGYLGGWVIQITAFALIYFGTLWIARKKNPPKMEQPPTTVGWKRLWRGSWPLLTAAIVLAVLNALTLVLRGSPWGITSAFALWGSQGLMAMGIDVSEWAYWQGKASLT